MEAESQRRLQERERLSMRREELRNPEDPEGLVPRHLLLLLKALDLVDQQEEVGDGTARETMSRS